MRNTTQLWPHSNFGDEIKYISSHDKLQDRLKGSGYILGPITGDHWFVYVADHSETSSNMSMPRQLSPFQPAVAATPSTGALMKHVTWVCVLCFVRSQQISMLSITHGQIIEMGYYHSLNHSSILDVMSTDTSLLTSSLSFFIHLLINYFYRSSLRPRSTLQFFFLIMFLPYSCLHFFIF